VLAVIAFFLIRANSNNVSVPNVVGQSVASATSTLRRRARRRDGDRVHNAKPIGDVISTDRPPVEPEEGQHVALTASLGPTVVEVSVPTWWARRSPRRSPRSSEELELQVVQVQSQAAANTVLSRTNCRFERQGRVHGQPHRAANETTPSCQRHRGDARRGRRPVDGGNLRSATPPAVLDSIGSAS